MLGRTHVVAGAAAWIALAPLAAHQWHRHLTLPELAVGVAVAGGASLWPDLDNHGQDCAAHTFGPISKGLDWCVSHLVALLGSGHRGATHSLLFTALVTFGAWEASRNPWATAVLVFFLAGMALHVAGPIGTRTSFVGQCAAGGMIAWATLRWIPGGLWLPAAVALGYASHIVVDMGNNRPVSWGWPLKLWPRRLHVTLIGPVGHWREYVGRIVLSGYVVWLAWLDFEPALVVWWHTQAIIHLAR